MAVEQKDTGNGAAPRPLLNHEILTLQNDITNWVYSNTLQPRDEVLLRRGGGKGLGIYDDLKRDPHVKGVLRKRSLAVIARAAMVTPASDDSRDVAAADLVKAAIGSFPFNRACVGLMDSVLKGYAVGEIVWAQRQVQGTTWILPSSIKTRNAQRFRFNSQGELRLLTREALMDGIALPVRKFIVMRVGEEETEDPYGLGLGNALFWPVFFKRKGIAFWFKFAERFGQPTVLGKYPGNATQGEKDTLVEAMAAISSNTSIAIPEGMMMDYLEAAKGGAISTHRELCEYMDGQISEATLGETLSTNIGNSGSRAASETHNEVRKELTDADCELLADTLQETLCKWIIEINMPGAGVPKIERDYAEEEDLVKRSERDKTIVEMGFEPSEEYINETYGGKWTKKEEPKPKVDFGLSLGARAPAPSFAERPPMRDEIDDLSDQAQATAAAAESAMIDQVHKLLSECTTLQEFSEKLLEREPNISTADFAAAFGEAMVVAELQGRVAVGGA